MAITSKTSEADQAYQISSEFGRIGQVTPAGGEKGRILKIYDLFQNTPARLKFLKSESAEALQIKNILKSIAMTHYEVSFRIKQNSKLLFFGPKRRIV